jgi:hypothetical protein
MNENFLCGAYYSIKQFAFLRRFRGALEMLMLPLRSNNCRWARSASAFSMLRHFHRRSSAVRSLNCNTKERSSKTSVRQLLLKTPAAYDALRSVNCTLQTMTAHCS